MEDSKVVRASYHPCLPELSTGPNTGCGEIASETLRKCRTKKILVKRKKKTAGVHEQQLGAIAVGRPACDTNDGLSLKHVLDLLNEDPFGVSPPAVDCMPPSGPMNFDVIGGQPCLYPALPGGTTTEGGGGQPPMLLMPPERQQVWSVVPVDRGSLTVATRTVDRHLQTTRKEQRLMQNLETNIGRIWSACSAKLDAMEAKQRCPVHCRRRAAGADDCPDCSLLRQQQQQHDNSIVNARDRSDGAAHSCSEKNNKNVMVEIWTDLFLTLSDMFLPRPPVERQSSGTVSHRKYTGERCSNCGATEQHRMDVVTEAIDADHYRRQLSMHGPCWLFDEWNHTLAKTADGKQIAEGKTKASSGKVDRDGIYCCPDLLLLAPMQLQKQVCLSCLCPILLDEGNDVKRVEHRRAGGRPCSRSPPETKTRWDCLDLESKSKFWQTLALLQNLAEIYDEVPAELVHGVTLLMEDLSTTYCTENVTQMDALTFMFLKNDMLFTGLTKMSQKMLDSICGLSTKPTCPVPPSYSSLLQKARDYC